MEPQVTLEGLIQILVGLAGIASLTVAWMVDRRGRSRLAAALSLFCLLLYGILLWWALRAAWEDPRITWDQKLTLAGLLIVCACVTVYLLRRFLFPRKRKPWAAGTSQAPTGVIDAAAHWERWKGQDIGEAVLDVMQRLITLNELLREAEEIHEQAMTAEATQRALSSWVKNHAQELATHGEKTARLCQILNANVHLFVQGYLDEASSWKTRKAMLITRNGVETQTARIADALGTCRRMLERLRLAQSWSRDMHFGLEPAVAGTETALRHFDSFLDDLRQVREVVEDKLINSERTEHPPT